MQNSCLPIIIMEDEMKNNNQKIGCTVDSCKYNNHEVKECTLEKIKVGCNSESADCKDDTICDSYDKKND